MKGFIMYKIITLSCLLLCSFAMVFAGSPDYRIKGRLDEKNVKYSIDKDGDFRIILGRDNTRSQMVLINSNTTRYQAMEVREIYSFAYKGKLDSALMRELLEANSSLKFGAWGMWKDKAGRDDIVVFSAKIPVNLDIDALYSVIWFVGEVADDFEKKYMHGSDKM